MDGIIDRQRDWSGDRARIIGCCTGRDGERRGQGAGDCAATAAKTGRPDIVAVEIEQTRVDRKRAYRRRRPVQRRRPAG